MNVLGAVPLGVFLVVAILAGIRLLRLGRETRELPELSIGGGLVLIALVGFPMAVLGRLPAQAGTPLGSGLFGAGFLACCAGVHLFYVFTWQVFRPASREAAAAVAAAGLVLLAIWAGMLRAELQGGALAEILPRTRPWAVGLVVLLMGAFAWSGGESLRYYAMLRRRLALGLADPVVANRFLLWGISGCLLPLLAIAIVVFLLAGRVVLRDPLSLSVIAAIGTAMSATWLLTFFPPASYRRFLRERAGRAHEAPPGR